MFFNELGMSIKPRPAFWLVDFPVRAEGEQRCDTAKADATSSRHLPRGCPTPTTVRWSSSASWAEDDRLQVHLWHGFTDQVRADVYFQTRRVGDSA
jgi:hypothetical protein